MSLLLDGPYGLLNVLGPQIIGGFLQVLLLGFGLEQVAAFLKSAATDSRYLKGTVFSVAFFALLQAGLTASDWWRLFVLNFGDPLQPFQLGFSHKLAPVTTCLISVPVHGYFVYRCWNVTNRNKFILVTLLLLVLTTITSSITVSYHIFHVSTTVSVLPNQTIDTPGPFDPFDRRPALDPTVVVWLISIALLDIVITAILLSFLIRSRDKSQSRYLHEVIEGLILLVWASAAPPCFCAVATCVIYTTTIMSGYVSFWTFFPLDLMGPLYAISLLITLNSRSDPHGEESSLAPTSPPDSELGHGGDVQAPDRLNIKVAADLLNDRFTPVPPRTPRKTWKSRKIIPSRLMLGDLGHNAAVTSAQDGWGTAPRRNDPNAQIMAIEMTKAADSMSMLGGESFSFATFHTPRSSFSLVYYPSSPAALERGPSPSSITHAYVLAPTSPVTTLPPTSPTSPQHSSQSGSPTLLHKSPTSPTSPNSLPSLGSPTYTPPTYGLIPISPSNPLSPSTHCVQVVRTCSVAVGPSLSSGAAYLADEHDSIPMTRSWVTTGSTTITTPERNSGGDDGLERPWSMSVGRRKGKGKAVMRPSSRHSDGRLG